MSTTTATAKWITTQRAIRAVSDVVLELRAVDDEIENLQARIVAVQYGLDTGDPRHSDDDRHTRTLIAKQANLRQKRDLLQDEFNALVPQR